MVLSSIDCCGTRPCAGGRRSTHNIATQAYAAAKRRAGQPYRQAIHPSQQRRTRLFQPSGFTASCSVRRMVVPDTNVLSELMRPTPNPSGVAWLDVVSGRAGASRRSYRGENSLRRSIVAEPETRTTSARTRFGRVLRKLRRLDPVFRRTDSDKLRRERHST